MPNKSSMLRPLGKLFRIGIGALSTRKGFRV